MAGKQVELKSDWDKTIDWDSLSRLKRPPVFIENQSYFRIKDFIQRKDKGSLIISGERGSGKTTTVISVLRGFDKSILPIYINALHLESIRDDSSRFLNTLELIKELISQFGRELRKHSYAENKKLNKLLTILNASSFVKREYTSFEGGSGIGGELGINASSPVINTKLAISTFLKNSFNTEELLIKAGYTIEDYSREFSDVIKNFESGQSYVKRKTFSIKSRLLEFGYSVKPTKKIENPKTVFIVDELDYYDQSVEKRPGPIQVLDAIKKLKNLFTLSEGHFIFITGKNTYIDAIDIDKDYNTLFSERIFIPKPDGIELQRYLEEIGIMGQSETIELFRWYLIRSSGHNYFELQQLVKARREFSSGKVVLNTEILETEEKLAIVHYALNTIYVQFLKLGIFDHNTQLLFSELSKVESNFDKWIHGQGLEPINLEITGDTGLSPFLASKISDAKKSLIRYLFRLSGTEIPAAVEDPGTKEIQPPWDQLKKVLTLKTIKRGIAGAITDDEIKILKLSSETLSNINNKLKILNDKPVADFSSAAENLKNRFSLSIEDSEISTISQAIESIEKKLYFERDPNVIKSATDILTRIAQTVELRYIESFGEVFNVELGKVSKDKTKLRFTDQARVFIIMKSNFNQDNFEIKFILKLKEESLINFILHTNIDAPPADKFYMFRLDSRSPNSNVGNGILLKNQGNDAWGYIDDIGEKRESLKPNTTSQIRIRKVGKEIKLQISKHKSSYKTISSINISEDIQSTGFLLELGEAEISALKFKT